MREKIRDKERILHIIEAIHNIFEFTEDKRSEERRVGKECVQPC